MRVCLAFLAGACAALPPDSIRPRPAPAAELVRTGEGLRWKGAFEEAAQTYREALARDAGERRAHVGLQVIGLRGGRELELRRAYREGDDGYLSGRLEPGWRRQREAFGRAEEPWRSMGLGSTAGARGRWSRARSYHRRAVALDPGNSWARIALGRALLAKGRLGEAEAQFDAARWSEPEHPTPYLGLSVIADRRGDLDGAFDWALEAYRRGPAEGALSRRLRALALRSGARARIEQAAALLAELGVGASDEALIYAGELQGTVGQAEAANQSWAAAVAAGATEGEVEAARRTALPARLRSFVQALGKGVRARYRHHAATGEAQAFRAFVRWARELFERETGTRLGPAGKRMGFTFVGKLVDPRAKSDEPLVRACAEAGLLLVLGQRGGGPPEALLADIVRREPMRKVSVRGMEVEREAVWTGQRHLSGYQEWAGGGDLAGLALVELIIVDLHAVARWEGGIRRQLRVLEPSRAAILAEPALEESRVTEIDDPAGVAGRLYLSGPLAMADEVLVHENAHLVEAALHLPVSRHPLRNLRLALRRGFRATEVLAFLERNAQLTAIGEGPTPLASLAVCCGTLQHGRGAHARGYAEIVQGFVDEIHEGADRYPTIDRERVILQQLHRLTADEVRSLARILMKRWRVVR